MSDFWVTVGGERAADFERVFGSATVPVTSPVPERVILPGDRVEPCYMLCLPALSVAQRGRLVGFLAERFGLPADEVQRDLDTDGLPLLAKDCDVTILNPQRWF